MRKQTMEKLIKLGWDKDWLQDIRENFNPKKKGKYEMKIFDIEDLSDEPDSGIYIDTACFDDQVELSIIHHFYEGMAYVMTIKATGEEIGRGIIDGAPFEEVEEIEGEPWQWFGSDFLGPKYKEQRDRWIAKLTANK